MDRLNPKEIWQDWKTEKIKKLCKSLKNSKARDECGLVYELFKPPYAGPDVYESLTKLFNLAKKELSIPEFFETMSITSFTKIEVKKVILEINAEYLIYQKLVLLLTKLSIQMSMRL